MALRDLCSSDTGWQSHEQCIRQILRGNLSGPYLVTSDVRPKLLGVAGDMKLHALTSSSCTASRLDAEVRLQSLQIPGVCDGHLARILKRHLLVRLQHQGHADLQP